MSQYIHPFPARMAPEIALQELKSLKPGSVVVDPMVGSGTTLRAAELCRHQAFGFDIDPLAVRIARGETEFIDASRLLTTGLTILKKLDGIDRRRLRRYPDHFDDETKDYGDYWFPRYNQTILAFLADAISSVRSDGARNALELILSGTIIVKQSGSSFAMDVAHSRPHIAHHLTPRPAEELFLRRLRRVAAIYESRERLSDTRVCVKLTDCRRLPIPDSFADMVITSPPYLNALDYMRGHRLSLIWLGYTLEQLRSTRSHTLGTENAGSYRVHHSDRESAIAERYSQDLGLMLQEVSRVLKPGGTFVCVIGDNAQSQLKNATRIIRSCRQAGLQLKSRRVRSIPAKRRYLPPPSAATGTALDSRMVRETILAFS